MLGSTDVQAHASSRLRVVPHGSRVSRITDRDIVDVIGKRTQVHAESDTIEMTKAIDDALGQPRRPSRFFENVADDGKPKTTDPHIRAHLFIDDLPDAREWGNGRCEELVESPECGDG